MSIELLIKTLWKEKILLVKSSHQISIKLFKTIDYRPAVLFAWNPVFPWFLLLKKNKTAPHVAKLLPPSAFMHADTGDGHLAVCVDCAEAESDLENPGDLGTGDLVLDHQIRSSDLSWWFNGDLKVKLMFITSFEPYIRSYQIISDHIRSYQF